MNRLYLLIAAAVALVALALPAEPLGRRPAVQVEFHEFAERMKESAGFEVAFEGATQTSPFTGRPYVHYETVAYFGERDVRSTRRMLYHTEGGFTLRCREMMVAIDFRRIRTCLAPSHERTYAKAGMKDPGSGAEKAARAILDEESVPAVLIAEYGLEAGRTYFARIRTESYHLPPEGPGGGPRTRKNSVLLVSSSPLPNDLTLTPLYESWSY